MLGQNQWPQFDLLWAAVVASFFGMNLPSGYEQHPSLFWWVVGGVTATSLSLSAGLLFICRVWPRIADQRHAQVSH
jgi:hypothetical protein